MNRIFKFAAARKRKIAIQPLRGQPAACSFCSGDLSRSALNAASMADNADCTGPLAVICSDCIRRLEPLCRLMQWYQCFFRQEDLWPTIARVIRKGLSGEPGTEATRSAVTDLLVRLLKRSFAIIAGYRANGLAKCPRTGVSLAPPRIALVCADSDACLRLLVAGADAAGLPTHAAEGFDLAGGDPIRGLRAGCNNDPLLLAAVGLLVLEEYDPVPAANLAVVYALASPVGLPGGVEVVRVPERSP